MQISRHWRLNSQRYRLQGTLYENGAVSLQPRPVYNDHFEHEPVNELREDNHYPRQAEATIRVEREIA